MVSGKIIPIALCVLAIACKTGGGSSADRVFSLLPNQPISVEQTATQTPSDSEIEAMREAFFAREAEEEEVFRVFVTSEGYARKQIAFQENIGLKEDAKRDQAIADEFRRFDMVNSLQEGQIRVELYPSTGKFYRVRQSKPSIMKETDRIMSDDMTRWQFEFKKNEIVPKDFRVSYQVLLRKKITREQALKILSEQNKKKK